MNNSILFPDHEDIVLYEHNYGYWIDDDLEGYEIERAEDLSPEAFDEVQAFFDKIAASGEYIPLNNEEACNHFVDVAIKVSQELSLDVVITKRARYIEVSFLLPFGPSGDFFKNFRELISLSSEINILPKKENHCAYLLQFDLNTYFFKKHKSALHASDSVWLLETIFGDDFEDPLIDDVKKVRGEINTKKNFAAKTLGELVDRVEDGEICDAEDVQEILDELSEWCDDGDERLLELGRKLCRYIDTNFPQMVKSNASLKRRFVNANEE